MGVDRNSLRLGMLLLVMGVIIVEKEVLSVIKSAGARMNG